MSSPTEPDNRFALITSDDHRGWIWIATFLSLACSLFFMVVRGIIKWQRYNTDDAVLLVAYICAVGHWSTIFSALESGLGKSGDLLSQAQITRASELIFASRILLLVTLALSKCCVLFFIRQLFAEYRKNTRLVCNILIGLMLAWGTGSALAVSLDCAAANTILEYAKQNCPNEAPRWKFVVVTDAIGEVLLVILVAALAYPVQMRPKRKLLVVTAFSFRLPVALFGIVYLHSYLNYLRFGQSGIGLSVPVSWQEAWLCYSLISATIPCLKGFIQSFTTAGISGALNTQRSAYGTKTTNGAFQMDTVKSAYSIRLRPEPIGHSANIYSEPKAGYRTHTHQEKREDGMGEENGSTASKGSQEMIIKKVVEWNVRAT